MPLTILKKLLPDHFDKLWNSFNDDLEHNNRKDTNDLGNHPVIRLFDICFNHIQLYNSSSSVLCDALHICILLMCAECSETQIHLGKLKMCSENSIKCCVDTLKHLIEECLIPFIGKEG